MLWTDKLELDFDIPSEQYYICKNDILRAFVEPSIMRLTLLSYIRGFINTPEPGFILYSWQLLVDGKIEKVVWSYGDFEKCHPLYVEKLNQADRPIQVLTLVDKP